MEIIKKTFKSFSYMQRLLNDDHQKRKRDMSDLNMELSNSKRMNLRNNSPIMQVNYVSK